MAAKDSPTWLGVLSGLVGVGILLMAADVVPIDPAKLHAPRWVLGLCGVVFLCVGALVWSNRYGAAWMKDAVAFVMIASMAVMGTWVAIGPGERDFSGAVGIGPFALAGELPLGRIVFGVGAAMTWLVALIPLWRIIASGLHPSQKTQQVG